jgi:Cu-Zn family superoxide dismutase
LLGKEKQMTIRKTIIFAGLLTAAAVLTIPQAKTAPRILKAHADIQGAPGSGISGDAVLLQTDEGVVPNVKVIVHVEGLPPNSVHGMHIHEVGSCIAPAFTSAGGHFDPGPNSNSSPDGNHPFHMGDLDNLKANAAGRATLEYTTSRVSLSPGPLSVFDANGSAIIVHVNEDMGTTGVTGGAGGARLACGVIVQD